MKKIQWCLTYLKMLYKNNEKWNHPIISEAKKNIDLAQKELDSMKWISVEDDLPETSDGVLCYGQLPEIPGEQYFIETGYWQGKYWYLGDDKHEHEFAEKITHWIPLPKAPEK